MGAPLKSEAALVCFSGGQDSTTALAWALSRYERVETVGFSYGQRHAIEMECRLIVRRSIADLSREWGSRLGADHVVDVDLVGQISGERILPPNDSGLELGGDFGARSRYIPGRNLIMLSLASSVAFRRDVRTLITGASQTEYSGYPDCRDETMGAVQAAISLASGMSFKIESPLMWLTKQGVWALAEHLGGAELISLIREETHTCYAGVRDKKHEWGYGCGSCDACRLRSKGWREFLSGRT